MSAVSTKLPFGGHGALRQFSIAEYHRLIGLGFFADDEQFELLDGYLVRKMARGSAHDSALQKLSRRFFRLISDPTTWQVRDHLGLTLGDSEPEPDLVVARGTETAFDRRHPTAAEAALVVEVADSSLARDTEEKLPIYARSGIPVYWVVNVPDRKVLVYTNPDPAANPPTYRSLDEFPPGTAVPVTLDGTAVGSIPVADILP